MFNFENLLNSSTLSIFITIGQLITVFYVLILNVYIDDYRELARKNLKNKKEKVFDDWFWDAKVIWPLAMGTFFVLSTIWATEITHDLKDKVRKAESNYLEQNRATEKAYSETGK